MLCRKMKVVPSSSFEDAYHKAMDIKNEKKQSSCSKQRREDDDFETWWYSKLVTVQALSWKMP